MKKFFSVLCAALLAFQAAPAEEGTSALSVEDLGFEASQTAGDAEMQEIYHRRSRMLKRHQVLGLATAVPLALALFSGEKATVEEDEGPVTGGKTSGRDLHAALGFTAAALYFASAYHAVFAPRVEGRKNTGATRLHRTLAWVHAAAMVATPVLGYQAKRRLDRNESATGAAKQHPTAAGVAAASFYASIVVLSFNF